MWMHLVDTNLTRSKYYSKRKTIVRRSMWIIPEGVVSIAKPASTDRRLKSPKHLVFCFIESALWCGRQECCKYDPLCHRLVKVVSVYWKEMLRQRTSASPLCGLTRLNHISHLTEEFRLFGIITEFEKF